MARKYFLSVIIILGIGLLLIGFDFYQRFFPDNPISRHFSAILVKTEKSAPEEDSPFHSYYEKGGALVYENNEYNISFMYPPGFTVQDFPGETDNEKIIRVQNRDEGSTLYITIWPFEKGGTVVTEEDIKQFAPKSLITEVQDVNMTQKATGKGIAYKDTSKKPLTREVWFTFNGFIYNVSTDFKNDALVKDLLNTWKFITN